MADEPILMIDGGHGIGPHLLSLLAERGFDAASWAAGDDESRLASAGAVVFNLSMLDEAALLAQGGLAEAVDAGAAAFMQTLQTVARAMIERGSGQIWVLAADDSFAYYMPLPAAPISHHMRVGAMRAIAKELARFGVFANAAVLQPAPETTAPEDWRQARAGVDSYAQKFRPVPLSTVAETLAFWLGSKSLPMNGAVVHFGNGVYDGNI